MLFILKQNKDKDIILRLKKINEEQQEDIVKKIGTILDRYSLSEENKKNILVLTEAVKLSSFFAGKETAFIEDFKIIGQDLKILEESIENYQSKSAETREYFLSIIKSVNMSADDQKLVHSLLLALEINSFEEGCIQKVMDINWPVRSDMEFGPGRSFR